MSGKVWVGDGANKGDAGYMRVVEGRALVSNQNGVPFREDLAGFFRYADTNGDGSGTKNANGDYSLAEEEFFIEPPAGQIFQVHRVIVFIRDNANFQADGYGGIAAGLAAGIEVQKRSGASTVLNDLTDGLPIQSNAGWSRVSFDVNFFEFGAGDNFIACRWTFAKSGKPVQLSPGQRLSVVLNDDLSALVEHTFSFQGIRAK